MNSELRDVLIALLSDSGYSPIKGVAVATQGSVWLEYSAGPSDVRHVLFLQYKPASVAFAIGIGLYSPAAMNLVRLNLPSVLAFTNADPRNVIFRYPCWTLFDAGELLGWPDGLVPAPGASGSCLEQIRELDGRILRRVFVPVDSLSRLWDFLLSNEEPQSWRHTHGVMRLADALSVGVTQGIDISQLRQAADSAEPWAKRYMRDPTRYGELVDELIRRFAIWEVQRN